MDKHPSPFTFAGRFVILVAIVIAIGGSAAYFWWLHDSLEGSFPLFAFTLPPFVAAGLFVVLSAWVMRLLGISFLKD